MIVSIRTTRQRFSVTLFFLILGVVMAWWGTASPAAESAVGSSNSVASQRPNILFIFADDWGRYAGAYARLEPGGVHAPEPAGLRDAQDRAGLAGVGDP